MKTKQAEASTEELRILKSGSCPSVLGKSTLSYQISCSTDRAIYISIVGNSGGGLFSKKPIALSEIIPLLNSDQITSGTLNPVFKGTSANTAGFILAVLLSERIVKLISAIPRKYHLDDLTGFNARISALIDPDTPPAKPAKVKKTEAPPPECQESQA